MHLEPAYSVIQRFGGPSALSGILGVHRTRVSNWMREREKGGTGGVIPQRYHVLLLDYAKANNINLAAVDFLAVSPPTAPDDSSEPAEAQS